MISAQLLDYFDRISDSPDAIERLRRFILDLAVRGKLVEQDPKDEPASELLKRIQAEKVRLVKAGEIRTPRELETSDEADVPFALPLKWVWCRLSEIGAIIGGGTPPSGDLDNFTDGGSGVAWLTPADLGKRTDLYVSHGERDLTLHGLRSSSATLMPKGSVLFTSRAPIGYTAIAANEISTNQGFKSVVPYLLDCNIYIAVYFRAFANWIDGKASGTTFREVSGKIVGNLPFPLPPLAEQHRIVAKVNELMALCDRLEAMQAERKSWRDRLVAASLQRLNEPAADVPTFQAHAHFYFNHLPRLTTRPEHIQQLHQTILNLAVCGKLVSQDLKDDPASELIERIQKEKERLVKEGKLKKLDTIALPSDSEFPFSLPFGWVLTHLQSLCISVTDGDHLPPPKADHGVPFLVIGNIRSKALNFAGCRYVSKEYYDALDEIRCPKKGDILYTLVGSYGIPVMITDNRPFCVQRHIGILRPSQALAIGFLSRILESQWVFDQATACATGIAQKTVPLGGLRKILIPLPPLAEQHRIVTKVDELMSLCDRLEAQLTTTHTESRRFLEATLHHALSA